jgi:hypothetical protein
MKRFPRIVSMFFALALVGLVAADSASAAGLRGRNNCDSCAEPACGAAEPACAAAEPACGAAEPACAAAPACCNAAPSHRGRTRRGLFSRRTKSSASSCSSCCTEPGCAATAGCAEPGCAAEPACGACAGG